MEINKSGYIINPGNKEKIDKKYRKVIETIQNNTITFFGNRIHSLYVRGSVSSGNAVYKYSDLDMVCILKDEIGPKDAIFDRKQCISIERDFDFIKFMDLTLISYNDLLYSPKFNQLRINLKTLSCCIYGENITSKLPNIKVGKELFLYLYSNIPNYLLRLQRFLYEEERSFYYLHRKKSTKIICRRIMRTILRSSLGLVMTHKRVYTPNVKTCFKEFVELFPQFTEDMKKILHLEYYPISDKKKVNNILNSFLPKYISLYKSYLKKEKN